MIILAMGDASIECEWQSTDDAGLFHSIIGGYVMYNTDSRWEIANLNGKVVAFATTHAMHPTTIHVGEWVVEDCDEWKCSALYFVHQRIVTSRDCPVTLEELGFDYFLRHKQTKPIWFVHPITGDTVHSGSKRTRSVESPGIRYCSLCKCCVSSNNFITQHLRNQHPEQPMPGELGSDFILRLIKAH